MKVPRYMNKVKNIIQGSIFSSNRNRTILRRLLCLVYISASLVASAQVQRYPANINPVLGQPYSLFVSDYSTLGSNTLNANIVFNDFNEPLWNFRLKIKIESSNVRLETKPGYIPSLPISLPPGVVRTFSGEDWAQYFNYNNLNISGISINELITTGRLPEGFYSFCFQALDYDTGDPLSEETCVTAWIRLADAPRSSLPLCGSSIDAKLQQTPFTWQLLDTRSPNAQLGTDFQLTIWEILEKSANPQTAVANGQALQIFQSELLGQPTYLYGPGDPPLELGKKYIYRVQAIDPVGKDRFKNKGYSEFCHFYYGWPTGGEISLTFPEEGGGFRKRDIPHVAWKSVDTQLPGQQVSYEILIAPMKEGQTPENAIQSNDSWYHYSTPQSPIDYDRSQQVNQTLEVMTKYSWQVKAFTDQQEVGKSEVTYFNGPSLMENFWAGNHRIAVDYLDGTNLNDMSGGGRIRLKADPNAWTEVTFEHIQLTDVGDFYVMSGGEFFYEPQNLTITLPPDLEENEDAYFDIGRFRIDKEGLFAEGSVRWPFPFATVSSNLAEVKSDPLWVNYNNFTINATANIAEGNNFDLLEPFDFSIRLNQTALIYIYNNRFRLEFDGLIDLPQSIDGTTDDRVNFTFADIDQLFFIEQEGVNGYSHLAPLAQANFEIVTNKYILDLSEVESPDKFSENLSWKGIYLKNFDLQFNKSLDVKGQFDLTEQIIKNLEQPPTNEVDAWITSAGLNLKFDAVFNGADNMVFQTFPSLMNRFQFEMDENQIVGEKSLIHGDFILPVVSIEDRFSFTVPLNNLGFQDGYLEDLTDTKFVFNEGSGDQEINITINRAVLTEYDKISMTIDLEWPSLGVSLNDLRGFKAWGDYNIGFENKNGTVPLTQRYNASMSGYAVTIGVIGAGSNDGSYAFATTSDAGLGDDVSGGGGAPSINVYSLHKNQYIPADAAGQISENSTDQISFADASSSATQDFEDLEENLVDQVEANQKRLIAAAEVLKANLVGTSLAYGIEDIVQTDETFAGDVGFSSEAIEGSEYNSRQQEIVYEIAAGFVEELARPILDPIKNKTDSLNLAIAEKVNEFVSEINLKVEEKVDKLITSLANELANTLKNNKVDVYGPINDMAKATSDRITKEIASSLNQTVENNILEPIKVLLKDQIAGRINKHITVNGTNAVYATLTGSGGDAEDALKELITGIPDVLEDAVKDVANFVSIDNLKSTLESTGEDFIKNIDLAAVGDDIKAEALKILENAVKDEINKEVSKLAAKYSEDLGLDGFGIGGENPIDFVGVAGRLAEGDIKGIFAVDPVRVKLRTPVIDLDGFMSYTPDHAVYGDVWVGDIDMTIKVPKKFAFSAIYFNGKKDDVSYWFCQVTPPDGSNKPYELGTPLSKTAAPLEKPVDIGIAQIMGASGRLYHHMSQTPAGTIVPDADMRYGASMHFVFFDKQTDGENLRLEVSGEINSAENGDYTVAFDGNLQVRSSAPDVITIDKSAAVQGTVSIRYNSAEDHFLGYAKVVVNKPGTICAEGSLLVDVKPGQWRVAIGSRDERIIFIPGCVGWSPTGWLDINESVAELGLGVQYSIKAETPKIPLGFVTIKARVDAGVAFGIVAAVRYRPSLKLVKAGVWADVWALVIVDYKFLFKKKWKSITLVDIYVRGELVMIFDPPPTILEGNLRGYVKLLGFSKNINASMRKEL